MFKEKDKMDLSEKISKVGSSSSSCRKLEGGKDAGKEILVGF